MDTIRRVALYVLYDEDGILDDYRRFFLGELCTVADEIIIIINGELCTADLQYLKGISKYIFKRENIGFEMKAYEDVFLHFFDSTFWKQFDEMILCNDSFYGPFVSMTDIFERMASSNADYWAFGMVDMGYVCVLQSNFIVYRKRIIDSGYIITYFNQNKKYPVTDFNQAIQLFEYGLFYYLKNRGFLSDTYIKYLVNFNAERPDYFLIECKLPIMRRKAFYKQYYHAAAVQNALAYLKEHTRYDVDIIINNAKRKYGYCKPATGQVTLQPMQTVKTFWVREANVVEFLAKYSHVYIYSAGHIGGKFWAAYREKIQNFKGFIVSDTQKNENEKYGYPILYYSEVPEGSAIVMALNPQNIREVRETLRKNDIILFLD